MILINLFAELEGEVLQSHPINDLGGEERAQELLGANIVAVASIELFDDLLLLPTLVVTVGLMSAGLEWFSGTLRIRTRGAASTHTILN